MNTHVNTRMHTRTHAGRMALDGSSPSTAGANAQSNRHSTLLTPYELRLLSNLRPPPLLLGKASDYSLGSTSTAAAQPPPAMGACGAGGHGARRVPCHEPRTGAGTGECWARRMIDGADDDDDGDDDDDDDDDHDDGATAAAAGDAQLVPLETYIPAAVEAVIQSQARARVRGVHRALPVRCSCGLHRALVAACVCPACLDGCGAAPACAQDVLMDVVYGPKGTQPLMVQLHSQVRADAGQGAVVGGGAAREVAGWAAAACGRQLMLPGERQRAQRLARLAQAGAGGMDAAPNLCEESG